MTMLNITLPIPPSTNNLYANVHGRRVLTTEARQYKDRVMQLTFAAKVFHRWSCEAGSRFSVTVRLWYRDNRRRDIDNIKVLIDSLAYALGFDDYRIDRLFIERAGVDKGNPRAEVTVEVL